MRLTLNWLPTRRVPCQLSARCSGAHPLSGVGVLPFRQQKTPGRNPTWPALRGNAMPTKDTAEQFVQRLAVGDAEGLGELFAESIDWRVPGDENLPWVGTRAHNSEVSGYLHTLWAGLEAGQSIVDFDTISRRRSGRGTFGPLLSHVGAHREALRHRRVDPPYRGRRQDRQAPSVRRHPGSRQGLSGVGRRATALRVTGPVVMPRTET